MIDKRVASPAEAVADVFDGATVLIGGAFVAWRRSAQAAAKDPAPAIAVQLDAVETDDKV